MGTEKADRLTGCYVYAVQRIYLYMMVTGGMTKLCGIGGWYNLTNSKKFNERIREECNIN